MSTQQQPTARPRLVEDWQTHLKFNNREPRTLYELGIAQADYEHRRRLIDLKAIAKKLEQIDALLPALAAQGIKIAGRDFISVDGGKSISLYPVFRPDDKLHKALLALGFRELGREEPYTGSRYDRVKLKLGRSLVLNLEVSKLPVTPPASVEVAA